jgi:hypothetical protein
MPLLYNVGPPAWTLYSNSSSPTGANTVRVNIIANESTSAWYTDVINKINTAKNTYYPTKTLTITQNNGTSYTGNDLTTSNYDVVFVWTDGSVNASLGANLNTFISNGGNLVIAVFAIASVQISGFTYTNCPVVFPGNQSMASSSLGTYTSGDALMLGVSTFNPGTSKYGAGGLTAQSGATVVARYNDNNLLVVKKVIGTSRTVALNFFPPSSTSRSDFWTASTNGGELMCNAIMWAGKAVS